MSEVKSKTIIPKRATKTKFASSESILKEGEIALIYPDTGPGTGAAKLVSGDGATVAKNLPIAIDGEAIGELKNSLDIAKKIIPITLTLAGWESVNGDNSAPYVQTVINEELKSSMNPDLVSMLDENATPNEQEVYNKNLAIISQGVGTVNNGSITYKVYKLPSADITIGLTRLGGVKEVETASGVDDVKVGGVSVVENKIAKIPAIPSADTFVPYKDAMKDVDIGDHSLVVKATGSRSDLPISSEIRVGKTTEPESGVTIPGISISTELTGTVDELTMRSSLRANANYYGLFASVESEQGNEFKSTQYQFSASGFSIRSPEANLPTVIKPGAIRGLDLPKTNDSAASKEYVDSKSIIINRISLEGIQGDDTISLGPTGSVRDLTLVISSDSPLPVDKYIGSVLTVVPKGESEPHIQGLIIPSYIGTLTDSSNSETFVYALTIQFKVLATAITESNPNGTMMNTLNTASISISIITDGVVVSLDKTKSQINGQS